MNFINTFNMAAIDNLQTTTRRESHVSLLFKDRGYPKHCLIGVKKIFSPNCISQDAMGSHLVTLRKIVNITLILC